MATRIAADLGIGSVLVDLQPQQKAEKGQGLAVQATGKKVRMEIVVNGTAGIEEL